VSGRDVPTGREGNGWLLAAAGLVAAGGLLWAAGAAATAAAGYRVRRGHPAAGLIALAHPGDPGRGWGGPVGPAWAYWSVTAALLGLVGAVLFGFWRLAGSTRGAQREVRSEGLAGRGELRRAAGRRALLARSAALRPGLNRPAPAQVGYRLGSAAGVELWASVEDSVLVVGPPRSGKGLHVVIPAILDAPGPVVTTSTRPDNLALTAASRARRGPVMVFDPQGLAPGGAGPRLGWSLTRGCDDPRVAMTRADTLVADAGRAGMENGTFWRAQAAGVTRCLLHAAALAALPAAEVFRWSHTAGAARDAVTVLTSHPGATPGWGRALDAIVAADPRTRDSIWAMVANTFAPLADPGVLAAVSPDPGAEIDPAAFLALGGTVYLLGTATGAAATAPLVAALIEDLVDAARRAAARSPGQRLDPPLAVILDEAANYPLPSLPALMSEGGGSGITTIAVLQSLAQARDRWGREAAGAIWDSAIVKVVLGGSANADDLADISRLAGEIDVPERSSTRSGGPAGTSMTTTLRSRPVLEPSGLRRLRFGTALVLLRSTAPILAELRPWTARADAADLTAGRRLFEAQPGA